MKAIFQISSGKPDVLQLGEFPNPTYGPKDVLVSNLATSVNPRDCLIRAGRYQLQFLVPKFPLILGSDCYGRVLSTGAEVKNFKTGDLVYGLKNPSDGLGTYADYVSVPAKNLALAPENLSTDQAAGIPLCALTAYQALVDHGQIRKGRRVLVIGASGGVGSFAIQIGKAFGATVDGVCSASNVKLVQTLGADQVFDYQTQGIETINGQYDIIFDTVGQHSAETCKHLLSIGSVFVTTVPTLPYLFKHLMSKSLAFFSIPHLRKRVVMVKPSQHQLAEITRLIEKKSILPVIDSVYGMDDIVAAHLRSQSKRSVGKIIVRTQVT